MNRIGNGTLCILIGLAASATFGQVQPQVISKQQSARSDEHTLAFCLENFKRDCGRFPSNLEGLQALVVSPSNLKSKWRGPYVSRRIPTDPWGRLYQYKSGRRSFTIITFGADGTRGGRGENADVILKE